VADAHHDAAGGHQRRGREAELLGAEQRGDRDVAAGLELPVGLDRDAAPEVVSTSVWCVSASRVPRQAACVIEVCGEAPVPPS